MANKTLPGVRHGRLVSLCKSPNSRKWLFQCDCGNQKEILPSSVKNGAVKSCGCLHKERCASGLNARKHGDARVGRVERLHNIWRGMLKRCNPVLAEHHPKYAGRGISVCREWASYEAFRDWSLGAGYASDLTIERRDNDGNYEPGNCRWVSKAEQAKNRRNSRWIEYGGTSLVLAEWSRLTGVSASVIQARLRLGWSVEDALFKHVVSKSGRPRKGA